MGDPRNVIKVLVAQVLLLLPSSLHKVLILDVSIQKDKHELRFVV